MSSSQAHVSAARILGSWLCCQQEKLSPRTNTMAVCDKAICHLFPSLRSVPGWLSAFSAISRLSVLGSLPPGVSTVAPCWSQGTDRLLTGASLGRPRVRTGPLVGTLRWPSHEGLVTVVCALSEAQELLLLPHLCCCFRDRAVPAPPGHFHIYLGPGFTCFH